MNEVEPAGGTWITPTSTSGRRYRAVFDTMLPDAIQIAVADGQQYSGDDLLIRVSQLPPSRPPISIPS